MRSNAALHSLTECEPLIGTAVHFAAQLLRWSDNVFPFAVMSIDGDIQNVFGDDRSQVDGGMIEELEWLITERSFQAQNTASVVVYLACVENAEQSLSDVIVTHIHDTSGSEITRLYPYYVSSNGVDIGQPTVY